MGLENRVDDGHVRGIGEHRRVEKRVIGKITIGADPKALSGLLARRRQPRDIADVALFDRPWPVELEPVR